MVQILPARFPDHLEQVRAIFRQYSHGLGIDLCFQGFEEELATLPGRYAEPFGCVLLAIGEDDNDRTVETAVVACGAIRPIDSETAEMKRLFVRPEGRGLGLGRQLAAMLCQYAHHRGYRRIRLDTLSSMTRAIALYESMGFYEIPPYVYNPIPEARYLELDLSSPQPWLPGIFATE